MYFCQLAKNGKQRETTAGNNSRALSLSLSLSLSGSGSGSPIDPPGSPDPLGPLDLKPAGDCKYAVTVIEAVSR